jgi:hypothetical protein
LALSLGASLTASFFFGFLVSFFWLLLPLPMVSSRRLPLVRDCLHGAPLPNCGEQAMSRGPLEDQSSPRGVCMIITQSVAFLGRPAMSAMSRIPGVCPLDDLTLDLPPAQPC